MEASEIPFRPLHRAYLSYMNFCLPAIGLVATGGDRSAYEYLLRGIHEFPNAPTLANEIAARGFTDVSYRRFTLGIVAMHEARKPIEQTSKGTP
jgi:demethylmenaquinone methyltransferase / 2-methoxy-6-polyprenyl-1,4-benzoquinol methylase